MPTLRQSRHDPVETMVGMPTMRRGATREYGRKVIFLALRIQRLLESLPEPATAYFILRQTRLK